jgi:hypothetical protein
VDQQLDHRLLQVLQQAIMEQQHKELPRQAQGRADSRTVSAQHLPQRQQKARIVIPSEAFQLYSHQFPDDDHAAFFRAQCMGGQRIKSPHKSPEQQAVE